MSRPIYKLVGERVALGPLDRSFLPKLHRWISDLEVARFLFAAHNVYTAEDELEWYESSRKNPQLQHLAIFKRDTADLLGSCTLFAIDRINLNAEIGMCVGSREHRGRGYGTDALRLLCDYAFNVHNLRMVYLRVFEGNLRARRCYEKVGFKPAGRLRQARLQAGKAEDVIYMDLLASELRSSELRQVLLAEGGE